MPLAFSVSFALPNWLIMLPFGILLLAIAFGPFALISIVFFKR
jgi:hypothetical protein